MLGANALPYANVHKHHPININPAQEYRMGRKRVALTALRNYAALMQLRYLKREQVLLLPGLCIHK